MTWGRWVKIYFMLLVSKELWFSWYFLLLGFLSLTGIFQSETPAWQAVKTLFGLFIIANVFTLLACIQGWFHLRVKARAEREAIIREVDERLRANLPNPPPEPEPQPIERSPWYLGILEQEYRKHKENTDASGTERQ